MQLKSTAWILAALMFGTAIGGVFGKPTRLTGSSITLETDVPKQFGEWTEVDEQSGQLINPETEQLLKTLYSQLLSRTYVNKQGYRSCCRRPTATTSGAGSRRIARRSAIRRRASR
jgi:hypothetical protein